MKFIKSFSAIGIGDIALVGGKNASLGEMYTGLSSAGIHVPGGFAVTAEAYRYFLAENTLTAELNAILDRLDTDNFHNLADIGQAARTLLLQATMPKSLQAEIKEAYHDFVQEFGSGKSMAVRSSATAEDLPNASFAGQQETYLNVRGEDNLLRACHRCYASLFTDRAIKYRCDNGFDHMKVALSIGVQYMIRSDLGSAGVMFTLDPDSGFEQAILVTGSWGLGENVVQGNVNTDEFLVSKPILYTAAQPVIAHKLGSKARTMVYSSLTMDQVVKPEDAVVNLDTLPDMRDQYILSDDEVVQLAKWAVAIEAHYHGHMDIEWAKDGTDGKLYIVQARPETVHSQKKQRPFIQYELLKKGDTLCTGAGLGSKIVTGRARILHSPTQIDDLKSGEILVTERTDPDWDPLLKKAAAIITNQGGRTSHAAIVAREVGAIAVVGTGNGTMAIRDGQLISVSTVNGQTGFVYDGLAKWEEKVIDLSALPATRTNVMLILAHPDEAFDMSRLPCAGVGLMRMEFIISNTIGIHPMALKRFDRLKDPVVKEKIAQRSRQAANKEDYFVQQLAEATAKMALAFYPNEVIVRMSDFKSNEYANLLGGEEFEPHEENPMIGFRGASRYYHPMYREGFEMECRAMKKVRDDMGLTNVKLMIPFCRTIDEAKKVIAVMEESGLKRGQNGLELYVMIEIPSNALQAEEFARYFDGFSIGSNDLTQLTLGADRDSELLSEIFSPFDPAVMQLIEMTLQKAKQSGTHTGLCGQAPSDYPEYARFLVRNGIDSISFNPDAIVKGIENIYLAEQAMKQKSLA